MYNILCNKINDLYFLYGRKDSTEIIDEHLLKNKCLSRGDVLNIVGIRKIYTYYVYMTKCVYMSSKSKNKFICYYLVSDPEIDDGWLNDIWFSSFEDVKFIDASSSGMIAYQPLDYTTIPCYLFYQDYNSFPEPKAEAPIMILSYNRIDIWFPWYDLWSIN